MLYYYNVFIIYSFFGYLIETFLKHFFFHSMNNGILYGPFIPIYGIGVCLIIFIMRFIFNRLKVNRNYKIFLLFFISFFVLSFIEYLGGVFLELITNKVYWDYSPLRFNIGPYISLEISFLWGIMSIVIVYFIKPFTDKFIKKIPIWVTYLVLFIIICDIIYSFLFS